MPTFDGPNLLITLDSGVTLIDVIEDLYEPWKTWMLGHPDNRRQPQAFFSEGGDPITTVIDQGAYIRLNNTDGWRIKPPEEDITIYYTSNLIVTDTAFPAFVPTDGAFTAAIIALPTPVTGINNIAADVFAFILENGESFAEAMRLIRAEAAGSIVKSGIEHRIKSADGLKDRIVADADAAGRDVTGTDATP